MECHFEEYILIAQDEILGRSRKNISLNIHHFHTYLDMIEKNIGGNKIKEEEFEEGFYDVIDGSLTHISEIIKGKEKKVRDSCSMKLMFKLMEYVQL